MNNDSMWNYDDGSRCESEQGCGHENVRTSRRQSKEWEEGRRDEGAKGEHYRVKKINGKSEKVVLRRERREGAKREDPDRRTNDEMTPHTHTH